MRISHALSFPEKDWPPGFATTKATPRPAITKECLYTCPVPNCLRAFAFDCEQSPPLDGDTGAVSDRVPWPEPRFSNQVPLVRQYVHENHPDFAPQRWPPGFAKQDNGDGVVDDDDSDEKEEESRSSQLAPFEYTCPVNGCGTTFRVLQACDPPITSAGKVSDQTPWPLSRMGPTLQAVRGHMQTYHMDVSMEYWPPGFATLTTTHENFCFHYTCPVPGCSRLFPFAKKLDPPMNVLGLVSDHCEWPPERFHTNPDAVRGHMRQEHPDVSEEQWPTGFAFPSKGNRTGALGSPVWGRDEPGGSSDDGRPPSFCV